MNLRNQEFKNDNFTMLSLTKLVHKIDLKKAVYGKINKRQIPKNTIKMILDNIKY